MHSAKIELFNPNIDLNFNFCVKRSVFLCKVTYTLLFLYIKLDSHESSRLSDSGSDTDEEVLQTVSFQLSSASGSVPEVEY